MLWFLCVVEVVLCRCLDFFFFVVWGGEVVIVNVVEVVFCGVLVNFWSVWDGKELSGNLEMSWV